jgi:hypothetical protein
LSRKEDNFKGSSAERNPPQRQEEDTAQEAVSPFISPSYRVMHSVFLPLRVFSVYLSLLLLLWTFLLLLQHYCVLEWSHWQHNTSLWEEETLLDPLFLGFRGNDSSCIVYECFCL